ncbi:family 43 glycosylhydrolase [Brooklawnia sp.]|uniref:family 43 glycosylhydrolase n=1 Tax=Brooklawnia sp. TaxID=2699740 RepID=UPI00311D6E95
MAQITNPVIPGMAPDPSIIRVGGDYYIATSTFHWTPAVQLFHSRDLANWRLIGYGLENSALDLRGTNTPAGIWAPHLSYDEPTGRFWIAYSHMLNMAGREFCADSFAIWADNIAGPWSDPIYLTSIGFDPALFHDEDGRHYATILEWESREGYRHPGHIVVAEIDLEAGGIIGDWHRVTQGFTTRGAAEAPQLYRHDDYYYLLIAAGGTGYAHGVEIGRSRDVLGPYEPHPSGEPIITSAPQHLFSLGDPDAGQFQMLNPDSPMQKSGHGSLVETEAGEWYVAHLMSRPLPGTTLNPLGRETSLQQVAWTDDGWLAMADGSNLAKLVVPAPAGVTPEPYQGFDITDTFDTDTWDARFMTPYRRQDPTWVTMHERPGYLRIHGGESLFSRMSPSIMATRATSFEFDVKTAIEFHPHHYSESAGLGLYYDSDNWLYARLYHSESLGSTALGVLQARHGERIEHIHHKVPVPAGTTELNIDYRSGRADIYYRTGESAGWSSLLTEIDVSYLSDEGVNGSPGEIGGFTGLFAFIGAVDSHQRTSFADFAHYYVTNQEAR